MAKINFDMIPIDLENYGKEIEKAIILFQKFCDKKIGKIIDGKII